LESVVRKDGSEERMREYPNQVAMHLLKMHRDRAMEAAAEPDEVDVAEVRESEVLSVARQRRHKGQMGTEPAAPDMAQRERGADFLRGQYGRTARAGA